MTSSSSKKSSFQKMSRVSGMSFDIRTPRTERPWARKSSLALLSRRCLRSVLGVVPFCWKCHDDGINRVITNRCLYGRTKCVDALHVPSSVVTTKNYDDHGPGNRQIQKGSNVSTHLQAPSLFLLPTSRVREEYSPVALCDSSSIYPIESSRKPTIHGLEENDLIG